MFVSPQIWRVASLNWHIYNKKMSVNFIFLNPFFFLSRNTLLSKSDFSTILKKRLFYGVRSKLLGWGDYARKSVEKNKKRNAAKATVGSTIASVIYRAASRPRYSRLAALRRSSLLCHAHSHTSFAIFNSFFPTDFRGKQRGCWQPIEDIEVDNIWLLSWSLGASEERSCRWNFPGPRTWFSARLSSKALSLAWFYFQEATKGPQDFYHEYVVSSFKVLP